jgi:hypothetical protein
MAFPEIPEQIAEEHGASGNKTKGFAPFYLNGLQAFLLFLLGASLLLTNRWFPAVDDECAIIDRAAQPILQTIRLYLHGGGEHEHPPLYDLIVHGWLRVTGGQQHLLRLPAIMFYVAGAWVLASTAKRQAGNTARIYTLLLIVLWPYGFHFGRLASWYSFCFFLIALATWNYLRYVESPYFGNWVRLMACLLLLLYSNYFAWALVGCFALDFIIENRRMPFSHWTGLVGTSLLLLAAYIPIARAFLWELHTGIRPSGHIVSLFLTGIYNLYSIFVSESVAPWFWALGLPVGAAIAISLLVTFSSAPPGAKRFLLYFAGLLTIMALLGVANTKRMLFISPWLILPMAVALVHSQRRYARRIVFAALLFIAAAGWYGIFSRKLYAAPHWVEPWETIAQNTANVTRNGGIVIGNNPSFFFYLTYALAPSGNENVRDFSGLLPDSTRRPNVYSAPQWIETGRPLAPRMILVKGPHFQIPSAPMDNAEKWLNERCMLRNSLRMVHDPGAELKERFAAQTGQTPWRIEIVTYECR